MVKKLRSGWKVEIEIIKKTHNSTRKLNIKKAKTVESARWSLTQ